MENGRLPQVRRGRPATQIQRLGRPGAGKVVDQQASLRQVASHIQLVARRARGDGQARNLYIGIDMTDRFRYTDFGFRPSSRPPGEVVDQRVLGQQHSLRSSGVVSTAGQHGVALQRASRRTACTRPPRRPTRTSTCRRSPACRGAAVLLAAQEVPDADQLNVLPSTSTSLRNPHLTAVWARCPTQVPTATTHTSAPPAPNILSTTFADPCSAGYLRSRGLRGSRRRRGPRGR